MELVKEVRKPKKVNPGIQLIYSIPKCGKTTLASMLPNHLILELEPGGANYISGRVQEINTPKEFNEILLKIEESKEKVCDFLVIDTATKLDEWSEIVGTYNYMRKPQGKTFNKISGELILHTDPRFETVHDIGQGYGYKHSREVMTNWYDKFVEFIEKGLVKYVILLAHVKDKLIESKNGDTVETIDINLTGKVKTIYASRVDAIGHLSRSKGKCQINYDNEHKVVCGGRCSHLNGVITISEKQEDGSIKTYWETIYLNNE